MSSRFYKPGDLVWVKPKRFPWWPGQVIGLKDCPLACTWKERPVACVKYLEENKVELVDDRNNLRRFECTLRKNFQDKGLRSKKFGKLFKRALERAFTLADYVENNSTQIPISSVKPSASNKKLHPEDISIPVRLKGEQLSGSSNTDCIPNEICHKSNASDHYAFGSDSECIQKSPSDFVIRNIHRTVTPFSDSNTDCLWHSERGAQSTGIHFGSQCQNCLCRNECSCESAGVNSTGVSSLSSADQGSHNSDTLNLDCNEHGYDNTDVEGANEGVDGDIKPVIGGMDHIGDHDDSFTYFDLEAQSTPVELSTPNTCSFEQNKFYSCEFCDFTTSRINNKIMHDKMCSPNKSPYALHLKAMLRSSTEKLITEVVNNKISNSEMGHKSHFRKDVHPMYVSPTKTTEPIVRAQGCKRTKRNLSNERRHKRSKLAHDNVKGTSMPSSINAVLSTLPTATPAVSSERKFSKCGALQRIREELQQGKKMKRDLFETKTQMNSDTNNNSQRSKPKPNRKKRVKKISVSSCQASVKVFEDECVPSESPQLLTPDPVSLRRINQPALSGTEALPNSTLFDPNLSVDACVSSDSEDDLPEALTPSKQDSLFERGDLVWAKVGAWCFWPAVVVNVYKQKKKISKLSVRFINDGLWDVTSGKKGFCLKLFSGGKQVVFPFTDNRRPEFEREGYASADGALILEAVRQAEDYLTKRGLGIVNKDAVSFFCAQTVSQVLPTIEVPPTEQRRAPEVDVANTEQQKVRDVDVADTDESGEETDDHQDDLDEIIETETMKIRNQKRTERCVKMVEFIKSQKMKDYLFDIYFKRRKSDLHKSYYGTVSQKKSIRYQDFGPVDDEDQRTEILDTLVDWVSEIPQLKGVLSCVDYVMDVWVPEAIVYSLVCVKKYSRRKAWQLFHQGIRFTKEEQESSHRALLVAAQRISPRDKQMYKEKLEDRIRMAMSGSQ